MKKCFVLICILSLALIAACSESEKYTAIPKGSTVLVLGDSLSYGTGAKEGEDYPTLLAQTTGWKWINEGVPGDTTAGGLERLPELLTEYKPQLLIVELGGNDLLRQTSSAVVAQNLNNILALAKAQGVQAILVAIPEISPLKAAVGSLSDHPLYEKLGKETNTPLIADVFSDVLSDSALKADHIHPNAAGYLEVSKKIHEALQKLGFAAS